MPEHADERARDLLRPLVEGRGAADPVDGLELLGSLDRVDLGDVQPVQPVRPADGRTAERMLARLERQQNNDRLPPLLPVGTVVAHKTGNLVGLTHDAGIIYTPFGPRVVVAMTANGDEAEADRLIANVGVLVYDAPLAAFGKARRSPIAAVVMRPALRPF